MEALLEARSGPLPSLEALLRRELLPAAAAARVHACQVQQQPEVL